MTLFDDVGAFNRKFDLPHHGDGRPPEFLTEDVLAYRIGFLAEELAEFCKAHHQKDMNGCADALADLAYIVLGMAHFMGIPFDDVWFEVQRANMTKIAANGANDPRSKRNHRFDIVKPEGWTPPDHEPALLRAAVHAFATNSSARGMDFDDWMASLERRRVALKKAA